MTRSKQPQIGHHVTLISSLEVRYEGILFTIDPNESTVALQNVKCLGTEDRQPPGEKAIPKSDTIYEFIIFRGVNIKSISCVDPPAEPERQPINDPSILKVGQPTTLKKDLYKKIKPQTSPQPRGHITYNRQRRFVGDYDAAPRGQWQPTNNRNYGYGNYNNRQRTYNHYNRTYRHQGRGAGRSNYRQRPNRYQNRRNLNPDFAPGSGKFLTQADHNVESTMKKDFNFEEANARFEKDKYLEEAKQKDAEADAEKVEEKQTETAEQETVEKTEESQKSEENALNNKSDDTKEDTKADEQSETQKEETNVKQSEVKAIRSKPTKPVAVPLKLSSAKKYDPNNSFFDELDDGRQPPEHADAQKRRAKDVKTFGDIAQTYSPKVFKRRKYRGRGRGRRGRGRYNHWRGRRGNRN